MSESETVHMEATNWLTVYPTDKEQERKFLVQMSENLGNFPETKDVVLALDEAIKSGKVGDRELSEKEKALLTDVFGFVTLGVANGIDVAVNRQERVLTHNLRVRDVREHSDAEKGVEVWSYYSGDYRGPVVGSVIDDKGEQVRNTGDVGNYEELYSPEYKQVESDGDSVNFMREFLDRRLEVEGNKPVVMVDIGCMYGASLLEIAGKFRDQIERGELVLIGTNVGMSRRVIENVRRPTNGTGMIQNYDQLYSQNMDLVHFIQAGVGELSGMKLELPNGQELVIGENSIDLTHESWSISAHSRVLDMDLARLGDLMKKDGILMSRRRDILKHHAGLVDRRVKVKGYKPDAFYFVRQMSGARSADHQEENRLLNIQSETHVTDIAEDMHERATNNLRKKGFEPVTQVISSEQKRRELNYVIWAGKESDELLVVDGDGVEFVAQRERELRNPERQGLLQRLFGRKRN